MLIEPRAITIAREITVFQAIAAAGSALSPEGREGYDTSRCGVPSVASIVLFSQRVAVCQRVYLWTENVLTAVRIQRL